MSRSAASPGFFVPTHSVPDHSFILRRLLSLVLAVAPMAISAGRAASAVESDAALRVQGATVGIAGLHEVGRWTSIVVRVEARRPQRVRLAVEATDPEGSVATFPSDFVDLPRAGTHELRGLFLQGRMQQGRVWIGIEDEAGRSLYRGELGRDVEVRALPPLGPGTVLVATLGGPAGFDAAAESAAEAAGDRLVVALDDPSALPATVDGWEALDVLAIAGSFEFDAERGAAMREWVRGGGRLVISVGGNVEEYRRSSLAEWAPVSVAEGPARLRELSGLETFADAHTRLTAPGGIAAARIEKFDGMVLVPGAQGPLLVRAPYGFGQVTFLAIDLADPAVRPWEAWPAVARKILGWHGAGGGGRTATRRGGRLGHSGIGDLATQLRASQEHFPAVRRFSLWGVMGLLLLYLLVIGPADYLLVNRLLKRPRWTWGTFPLIVLGGALLAAWGAAATNGDALRSNRLDVVDIDAASGAARGRSWATVLSPETRRYAIEVPAFALGNGAPADGGRALPRLGWSGIPEAIAGGMYRSGGFELVRPPYRFGPDARSVENLPIATWGTRTLEARWRSAATGLVDSTLRDAGLEQLQGTLAHRLPGPLEDWVLAFGNRVFLPGAGPDGRAALDPGDDWRPGGTNVTQRELKGHLTGTTSLAIEGRDRDRLVTRQSSYDPLDRDPVSVLRMLTFHRAAGGSDYTGLDNQLLGRLELTDALDAGRAVLFGRLRVAAPPTRIDDAPVRDEQRTVIVRIVVPVAPREAAAAAAVPSESRSTSLAKARP